MNNAKNNPEINSTVAPSADISQTSFKRKLGKLIGRHTVLSLFFGAFVVGLTGSVNAQTTWYSGMRAFGQVTVEPAIDLATGNEIFLLTPNKAPLPSKAAQRAHAPLYLVLYPESSSIDANSLNCQPTNCDHAQTFAYPLKGHDHLVGMPHTGDFNVAWDVFLVAFTDQGFSDGAIDTRILTLDQLKAAVAAGDVSIITPAIVTFNCSITSPTTYLKGTPLTFSIP